MGKDEYILLSIWLISIVLLLVFIPKARIREAALSFMITQALAWILGLTFVYYGFLAYPKHFFAAATDTSMTYEFLAFPTVSAIMNMHYPKDKSMLLRVIYLLFFPTILTVGEILLVRYTNLILYIHWTWYASWLSIAATLMLAFVFQNWFFKGYLFRSSKPA